ncbi:MAG: hypothetical protein JWQ89_928 [Devosia sp.]|uniref:DUF2934 domain-containing protein n=1 Tax=Devosia sp. TaxID=1871048 RepID=UPI00260F88C1|nr:DUF2934 domain-containing protein [Devosia sp.]MDB5539201.1 hypothetical protein [Devosia sp.]
MPDIKHDKIRDRAYALWEADGSPEGMDKQYWERAERELSEESGLDISEEEASISPIPLPVGLPGNS